MNISFVDRKSSCS